MAHVWHRQQLLHIKPPWGMIPRNLGKLRDDKARAVILAPRWQSAWWWTTLESMRLGPPYIISGSLYKDRDCQLAPAPGWLTQVCLLDGTQVGGTTRNTKPICIKSPRRTSHLTSLQGTLEESLSRMKMLELISRNGTNTAKNLTTKLQSGSYGPIVVTNELAHAIQGICGSSKEVSDHPKPTDYPQKGKQARRPYN